MHQPLGYAVLWKVGLDDDRGVPSKLDVFRVDTDRTAVLTVGDAKADLRDAAVPLDLASTEVDATYPSHAIANIEARHALTLARDITVLASLLHKPS